MTVTPVVDYEPHEPAAGAWPSAGGRRVRHLHVVAAPAPPSTRCRRAAAFADAALRSVLEVIDRRRPLSQLRPMLLPGLIDSVAAFADSRPSSRAGAGLHRVHVQAADAAERAFEVSAVYRRGTRLHAVAGRVESVGAGDQWQLVALHLG